MLTKCENYSAYYHTRKDKQLTFMSEKIKPANSFLKK